MGFWKKLLRCAYDPSLYHAVAHEPLSKAFVFFIRWIALLSVAVSVSLIFSFGMFLYRGGFVETVSNIKSFYPEDLVITIDKGHVSTNQNQPYAIPAPASTGEEKDKSYDYLMVFDTEYPVTAESARDYNTPILIGKTSIGFQKSENEFRTYEVPKDLNVVIDQAWTDAGVDRVAEWMKRFGLLAATLVLPIGFFMGFFIGLTVCMAFFALFVWLVAHTKGVPYSYKQAYSATIYLSVIPQSALSFFPLFGTIPFFRTISVVALAILNIRKEVSENGVAVEQADTHETEKTGEETKKEDDKTMIS